MSNVPLGPSRKDFLYVLLALAAITGSLVALFSLLATIEVDEMVALVFFLVVGGLLLAGYMVGLLFLGLALVPVVQRVRKRRDQRMVTSSA